MEGAQQLHTGQPVHHLSCSYSICFSPLPTPTSELPGPALGAIIQADGNPSSRRLWGENAIRSGCRVKTQSGQDTIGRGGRSGQTGTLSGKREVLSPGRSGSELGS